MVGFSAKTPLVRDFLLKFPHICLCNGYEFLWQRDSVPVLGNRFPTEEVSVCNQFGCYGIDCARQRVDSYSLRRVSAV